MEEENKKIWMLVEKLYIYCFGIDVFKIVLKDLNLHNFDYLYGDGFALDGIMGLDRYDFSKFILSGVPVERRVGILKKMIFDPRIISTETDPKDFGGPNGKVCNWFNNLLHELENGGYKVDVSKEKIEGPEYAEGDLIVFRFDDEEFFLNILVSEINGNYMSRRYLSVVLLSRKLAEALTIKILRKFFLSTNRSLIYNQQNRYHKFESLIDNLKRNSNAFNENFLLIQDTCDRVEYFKNEADLYVHNDHRVPGKSDIGEKLMIPYALNLLKSVYDLPFDEANNIL